MAKPGQFHAKCNYSRKLKEFPHDIRNLFVQNRTINIRHSCMA